jgi:hypothetical protein
LLHSRPAKRLALHVARVFGQVTARSYRNRWPPRYDLETPDENPGRIVPPGVQAEVQHLRSAGLQIDAIYQPQAFVPVSSGFTAFCQP